jgi:hypothetical protein
VVNTINLNKTHCDHGHKFTEENTRRTPQGWRVCVACNRERRRRYMAGHRAKKGSTPRARVRRQRKALRIMGVLASFWANTRFEDRSYRTPCIIYTGTIANTGYGVATFDGRQYKAHRVAYEAANGPIPINGETGKPFPLDHLCRVRPCVNPAHLEPVTDAVNVLRGISPHAINARKTHCGKGHEYTPENTRIDSSGHRSCRECSRISDRERYARLHPDRVPRPARRLGAVKADSPPKPPKPARQPKPPKPKAPPRELAPCGTLAARLRHVRNGEPIDEACRAAHSERMRQWRTGRRKSEGKAA